MPSVFGEIGRKIEGWYRPICASFRKLLRESSQAARVRLPIRLADLLRDTGIAIQMGHKIRRESPLIQPGFSPVITEREMTRAVSTVSPPGWQRQPLRPKPSGV